MKNLFFVFFFSFSSFVFAAERLAVKIPSQEESQVQQLLESLKSAVNNGDYAAYSACLTKENASKNKKRMALMFLEHDMSMDFEKFHVVDSDGDNVEFIAKYTIDFGANEETRVSSITTKRLDDRLVISREDIISKNGNRRRQTNDVEFGGAFDPVRLDDCPDGNCPLANRPVVRDQDDEDEPKKEAWVSMFNDANGNSNENGPMWVDPLAMVRAFPDKYPPSCGGKCEKVNPKLR